MSLNILLVDDSLTIRAVMKKTLHLAGVPIKEIYQAGNGQEALDILSENWIDLVFADINMPVMNGVEMIEKMAENDMMKTIPVVVVSTEGSQTRIDRLKACGITAYIRKPFHPENFREVVENITGVNHGA